MTPARAEHFGASTKANTFRRRPKKLTRQERATRSAKALYPTPDGNGVSGHAAAFRLGWHDGYAAAQADARRRKKGD